MGKGEGGEDGNRAAALPRRGGGIVGCVVPPADRARALSRRNFRLQTTAPRMHGGQGWGGRTSAAPRDAQIVT